MAAFRAGEPAELSVAANRKTVGSVSSAGGRRVRQSTRYLLYLHALTANNTASIDTQIYPVGSGTVSFPCTLLGMRISGTVHNGSVDARPQHVWYVRLYNQSSMYATLNGSALTSGADLIDPTKQIILYGLGVTTYGNTTSKTWFKNYDERTTTARRLNIGNIIYFQFAAITNNAIECNFICDFLIAL